MMMRVTTTRRAESDVPSTGSARRYGALAATFTTATTAALTAEQYLPNRYATQVLIFAVTAIIAAPMCSPTEPEDT